jgi:hypothetical protein
MPADIRQLRKELDETIRMVLAGRAGIAKVSPESCGMPPQPRNRGSRDSIAESDGFRHSHQAGAMGCGAWCLHRDRGPFALHTSRNSCSESADTITALSRRGCAGEPQAQLTGDEGTRSCAISS